MPKLICISGMSKDEEYQLHDGDNSIGRSDSNDICVMDKKSSRAHCKLIIQDSQMSLVDLDSTNGVRVNNTFVEGNVNLSTGDHIRIGQTVYLVSDRNSQTDPHAHPNCVWKSAKISLMARCHTHAFRLYQIHA